MKPVLILAAFVLSLATAHAGPVAEARTGDVRVVVYGDPCRLKEVANLPFRATWEEGGKVFEGCWGGHEGMGIIMAYFDDRTVAAIPLRSFVKVHSL